MEVWAGGGGFEGVCLGGGYEVWGWGCVFSGRGKAHNCLYTFVCIEISIPSPTNLLNLTYPLSAH